jgi:beta-lactamase regulating signal transducer with metallopeptidase domain
MIFAARGFLVSLAFFAVVYCPLSLLVVLAWQGVRRIGGEFVLTSANLLFGLRVFPFVVSVVVTLFFTFPSFWLMERASPDEDAATFILALCSLVIFTAGLFRVLRTQARTTRAIAQWLMGSPSLGGDASTPALKASNGAPALILVGIQRPRVMLSDMAAIVLSSDELQVAVRHELAHMRAWDNLKKVLISATPFPGMGRLGSAWREAAELAADDAAVASRQEALDLATALIKLSRSSQQWPQHLLATGLVSGSSIGLRVERLLRRRMVGRHLQRTRRWSLLFLLTMTIGVACNHGTALILTHRLTELLVP